MKGDSLIGVSEQTASGDSVCITVSMKKRTLYTSDLNIVIVRLRTSCYWV